jgi:hypothetical protein
VRAWERQPGETSRAYEASSTYRDLGAARSLAKVGELLGKSTGLMERWSAVHSWVDRVAALEARDEMLRRDAIEEHLQARVQDHAAREARIQEKLLEIQEHAAEQALSIVRWPLSEQRILRKDEDGRDVTYVFSPARWTKATAVQLAQLAAGAVAGLSPGREVEAEAEYDLSEISLEEIQTYLDLDQKIRSRVKKRPE